MLKEIKSEQFIENPIKFSKGLNAVLGDDISTNSIGKSTLLMIVDFAFGGKSFLTNDSGVIKQLGHQIFSFKFEFEKENHYFKRSTENPEIVSFCDSEYNTLTENTVEVFTKTLKEKYNIINPFLSFRQIVSNFSRIWGKDNYNVDKPLQAFTKEPESTAVTNLIKLFDLYEAIVKTEAQIKEHGESKKVLAGIHKKNYVEKITKTDFKKNEIELRRIQDDITNIKDNLLQYTLNIEELTSKEMIELKTEKSKFLQLQSVNQNKIRRLQLNLEQRSVKSKYFNKLSSFFENTNEAKIEEIESFHNKIGTILKRELNNAKKILEEENHIIEEEISKIDLKISSLLENVKSPKFIVEKIYDLTIESNKISTVNKFYTEKEQVTSDLKQLNLDLEDKITGILKNIEEQINTELITINKEIHIGNKKTPKIILNKRSYTFDHQNNTGTGKSFSDLIEFDLVVLKLTCLPFLIHDSVVFKNIEDSAVDKIIEQYSTEQKQIFVSLDGIIKYSEKSIEILTNKKVIQLNDSRKLFNQDWR
ncbi:DUF2326 domain-containing protein [Flavobacterium algicola]|uniref:DUF2326 domain-containing protein n=1 Tax=Flavobacterium algicola TaxID=556529 RepID=UPI001EFD49EC|nr:DUF2326 domain-containing protein [Flavobacterium algicola]MCG9793314.1 DUF2326 domain-containing protein [Flavobacterium algicola]